MVFFAGLFDSIKRGHGSASGCVEQLGRFSAHKVHSVDVVPQARFAEVEKASLRVDGDKLLLVLRIITRNAVEGDARRVGGCGDAGGVYRSSN